MNTTTVIHVIDKDGARGSIESATQPLTSQAQVRVTLADGNQVLVPGAALEPREAHTYYLPLRFAELPRHDSADTQAEPDKLTIPVIEEALEVHKRVVERGVRITKSVQEREEIVDEPALREEVEIERVPVNRVVSDPVPVRQEGDTLIIPLLEEVVVVEKRLVLREELHVTRHRSERHDPQRVMLRREDVSVEPRDKE